MGPDFDRSNGPNCPLKRSTVPLESLGQGTSKRAVAQSRFVSRGTRDGRGKTGVVVFEFDEHYRVSGVALLR